MENQSERTSQVEPEAVAALVADINQFLGVVRAENEMRQMDRLVADKITTEDFLDYLRYKEFCLNQLGEYNQTPGVNHTLCSAIERGFVLGYWFACKEANAKSDH